MLTKKEKSLLKLAKLSNIFPRKNPVEAPSEILDSLPFFIISSGRSGTTLLASILDSHPQILIPPEQFVMHKVIAKYKLYNWMPWSDLCNVIVGDFARSRTNVNWQLETAQLLTVLAELAPEKRSLRNIIDTVYRAYGKQHKQSFSIWGDKTPKNSARVENLLEVFPDAHYLALIRDGRDVVSSILEKNANRNIDYACEKWMQSVETINKARKSIRADQFCVIRYEDLVVDPLKTVRKILKFLNCDGDISSLSRESYIKKMGGMAQAKHFGNLHKPINEKSVGAWRQRLSAVEAGIISKRMENYLKQYKYQL